LEIGGEVYLEKKTLELINKRMPEEEKFSNPRNAAAGFVRQLDPEVAAQRDLKMYCYSLDATNADALEMETQQELMDFLRDCGFPVEEGYKVFTSLKDVEKIYATIGKKRNALPYDIDGVVI